MAYSELIKNFERVRSYMREFYVYGFKSRDGYAQKSARTYDNERRRCESWLGEYMRFTRSADGKSMFLSIDSRAAACNPLYKAWKAASFTDGDITLHFIIFDLLAEPDKAMTLSEITEAIYSDYLNGFSEPTVFDESTVRKKLREYVDAGLLVTEKSGRTQYYRRREDTDLAGACDMLRFFSEVAPCGVIGSFLLDKAKDEHDIFSFKHHYITQALDSGILCELFCAMSGRRAVTVTNCARRHTEASELSVVPLRIYVSVQSGRQYLLAYSLGQKRIISLRVDYITAVKPEEEHPRYSELRARLDAAAPHMWGVSCNGRRTEHVEFTVHIGDGEEYIYNRLEREKRCGTVERISPDTCRFSADVYDSFEMLPWIRTFICRITQFSCSNNEVGQRFVSDLDEMCCMYGLNGGDGDAVQ